MLVEDLKWVQVAKTRYTEEGEKIGLEKGKAEGKAEGILLSAKAFIQNGIPPEKVAAILQLPLETVKSL